MSNESSASPRRGKTGKDRSLKATLKSTKASAPSSPSPPKTSPLSTSSTPDLPTSSRDSIEMDAKKSSPSVSPASKASHNRSPSRTSGTDISVTQTSEDGLSTILPNVSSEDVTSAAGTDASGGGSRGITTLSVHARYKELKEARKRAVTNPEETTGSNAVNEEQKIALLAEHVKYVRNGFRMGLAEEGYSALRGTLFCFFRFLVSFQKS